MSVWMDASASLLKGTNINCFQVDQCDRLDGTSSIGKKDNGSVQQ